MGLRADSVMAAARGGIAMVSRPGRAPGLVTTQARRTMFSAAELRLLARGVPQAADSEHHARRSKSVTVRRSQARVHGPRESHGDATSLVLHESCRNPTELRHRCCGIMKTANTVRTF